MYLNLFHNGKKYIYETGNKLNIGHLKEISEGILKSNKNIMQIIYDNPSTYHKYINPNDNTFLRDLIPKGKTRAKFSIKLGSGNPGSNSNDIKVLQKSADTEKGIGDISQKNFFGNFSYMYSAQKKFNMMITNKFNELLLELRELIRRINEVYDEIYKNFAQSNINYNQEVTKSNKNDLSNKMKQITEYEFHMIKFFEKEKLFYEKLNAVMRHCLMEQNGKIVVSNKTMKDLYKNMFTDSNNNIKVDLNEKNEYISNIIENPFMKGENNSKKKNSSNLSLEDELFHDKIFKKQSKQFLHSLSSLNIDNHNNNINSDFSYNNLNNKNNSNFNFNPNNEFSENKSNINIPNLKTNKTLNRNNTLSTNNNNKIRQSKLMISTEIGPDGVQRGKIVLFSEDKKSKKDLNGKDNKEKSDKTKEENESGNNENNSANLDLIKSRLSFRNRKGFGLPSFRTNLNINKNLNLFPIEEKDDKKRLNTNNQKNTGTNMNKNSNEENNKNNKKDPKNPDVANENISDSTEYLHKEKNKNKEKSKKDLTNVDNKDKDSKNQDKDKNGNNNDPNNQNDKNKENNNDPNSNNKITDEALLALNNNNNENIDSENASKKKKKPKKERKKRKNSSEDNSSEDEDDKEKKKEKKKKNSEGGDSKESERSKKSSTKDLFDLHLLRNLTVDKDNPYKKPSYPVYGTGLKKVKENTLIRPEIPESDDSEEEKKKLALVKKKKKNHIKNKYDFLI